MTDYLYFQTIIQFRIPLEGSKDPEVMKKFTTPMKGTQNNTTKKKQPTQSQVREEGEVLL